MRHTLTLLQGMAQYQQRWQAENPEIFRPRYDNWEQAKAAVDRAAKQFLLDRQQFKKGKGNG